jgi:DNA polymerase I-like protein with 3'-5' exonuclease and polymerase domains
MGQGTARDLMMECLLRIDDLDPRVIHMLRIQVHDEIVLEVPEDEVEQVIGDVLKRAMTFQWAPPGASIPITVEVDISGYGRSWADCYAK